MLDDKLIAKDPEDDLDRKPGAGWAFLKLASILATTTIWFGVVATAGPALELWLAPPLRMELNTVSRDANRLVFAMEGQKVRNCPIVSLASSWVYSDGSVMPTTLSRPPDNSSAPMVGAPARPLFEAGDRFFRYPFSVSVPASFVQGDTYLRITSTYRCHIFWLLPVVDLIPANEIPPREVAPEAAAMLFDPAR